MNSSPLVFDRVAVHRHLARAAKGFVAHSALFDDTGAQIEERVGEVKRVFETRLEVSPFPAPLRQEGDAAVSVASLEAEILPFGERSFDLVTSNLDLHWVNDVPGVLAQIRAILKPEGLFIGALIGEHSLHELRECLLEAEIAVSGGASPRLSPTIDLQMASGLMQRAGFTLPVADKETVTLLYRDMFGLMRELRGMGQANAHSERLRRGTRRAVFFEAARLYRERYGDAEGRIPATFDIIYLHGWR